MGMTMQEVVRLLHAGEVPPKPLNGKGERYSASTTKQIDTTTGGCERRHWFEQVVGIDPPVGPALGVGTRVHNNIERALKKGDKLRVDPSAPMEERLAARGLPHLPPFGTVGMHVEREFKMGTWPNGPEYTGTIDLMVAPVSWDAEEAELGNPKDTAELIDHKTTGSYAKYAAKGWALSERTKENAGDKARKFLDDDIQNIAYTKRILLWYPVPFVKSTWVYYPKDGGNIVPVRALMERKETSEKWRDRVLPLVEKMHGQHKQRPALAQVEANEEACGNYGGCPHRAYCVDYKGTGARTNMGKLSQALLEDEDEPKATKKSKAAAKEEAPAMNPPPPPKTAAKKGSLLSDLDEEEETVTKSSKTSAPTSEPSPKTTAGSSAKPSASPSPTTTSAPAGAGFALFLGCEPVESKRPRVYLTTVLDPIAERVAAAHKVPHIGLVKYDGINHTSAALQEWLEEFGAEWDGVNVVVGRSSFHQEVAERVLYKKAIAVARAMA